jgi:hypothetical protein
VLVFAGAADVPFVVVDGVVDEPVVAAGVLLDAVVLLLSDIVQIPIPMRAATASAPKRAIIPIPGRRSSARGRPVRFGSPGYWFVIGVPTLFR